MKGIREKISEYVMYLALVIWFSSEVVVNSNIEYVLWWKNDDFNRLVAVLTTCLLVFNIAFLQHYEKRELIVVGICSLVILIGTMSSGYNILMSTWLFILASKHINFETIAKLTYLVLIVAVAYIIILYFCGAIDERIMYRGGMVRHSWGFIHPNWLGVRVFQIVIMHFYLRRRVISIFDYVFLVAGLYFVYTVPNCQTAYYAMIAFFFMLVALGLADRFIGGKDFLSRMFIVIAVISNIGSVILSLINVRNYSALAMLDRLMSKRFSMCHKTIHFYGIKIFGQEVDLYTKRFGGIIHSFFIDTAYVAILVRYGILVYIIFSLLYIVTMVYCHRQKNYMMVMLLSTYSIYGIMENTYFSMNQNVFLLSISLPIYLIRLQYNDGITEKEHVRYKFIV